MSTLSLSLHASPCAMPPAIPSRLHTYHHLALPSNTLAPFTHHTRSPSQSPGKNAKRPSATVPVARSQRLLASLAPLSKHASVNQRQATRHRTVHRMSLSLSLCQSLAVALSDTMIEPLSSLSLVDCHYESPAACQAMIGGLSSHSQSLKSLSLVQCTNVDWEALSLALLTFPNIVSLSFAQSTMREVSDAVIDRLLSLPLLTSLNVASTGLTQQHLLAVTNSLNVHTHDVNASCSGSNVRHLDISNNSASVSVAQSLATALQSNTALQSLNAQFNRFTVTGTVAVIQSLVANTALTAIDLRWNGLTSANVCDCKEAIERSVEKNESLMEILLCVAIDPVTALLLSSIQRTIDRNRSRLTHTDTHINNDNLSAPRQSVSSRLTEYANPLLNLQGVNRHELLHSPSPLPSFRGSYSESIGSSPSLLTPYFVDESPKPPALQSPMSSSAPGTLPIIVQTATHTNNESKLGSVVLVQEQEIARQSAVIARLMKLCQSNTPHTHTDKKKKKKANNVSGDSASSPTPSPMKSPESPPVPLPRPSFSLDPSIRSAILQASHSTPTPTATAITSHSDRDSSEVSRNFGPAATIALLESEKDQQAREMDALKSKLSRRQTQEEKDNTHALTHTGTNTDSHGHNHSLSDGMIEAVDLSRRRSLFDDRARLINEINDLRATLSSLTNTSANIAPSSLITKSRRDSLSLALTEQRADYETKLSERDEKIQSLLSAQRVLAADQEAKASAMMREWREKESYFNFEFRRLKEESQRLKLRLRREEEKSNTGHAHTHADSDGHGTGGNTVGMGIMIHKDSHDSHSIDSDSDSDDSDTDSLSALAFTVHPSHSALFSPALPTQSQSPTVAVPATLTVASHRVGHVVAERIASLSSHSACSSASTLSSVPAKARKSSEQPCEEAKQQA